jgi:hypothetical protein
VTVRRQRQRRFCAPIDFAERHRRREPAGGGRDRDRDVSRVGRRDLGCLPQHDRVAVAGVADRDPAGVAVVRAAEHLGGAERTARAPAHRDDLRVLLVGGDLGPRHDRVPAIRHRRRQAADLPPTAGAELRELTPGLAGVTHAARRHGCPRTAHHHACAARTGRRRCAHGEAGVELDGGTPCDAGAAHLQETHAVTLDRAELARGAGRSGAVRARGHHHRGRGLPERRSRSGDRKQQRCSQQRERTRMAWGATP